MLRAQPIVHAAADAGIEKLTFEMAKLAIGEKHIGFFGRMAVIGLTHAGQQKREAELHVVSAFGSAGAAHHAIHVPFYIVLAAVRTRGAARPAEIGFEGFDRAGGVAHRRWRVDDGCQRAIELVAGGESFAAALAIVGGFPQPLEYARGDYAATLRKRFRLKESVRCADESFDFAGVSCHVSLSDIEVAF